MNLKGFFLPHTVLNNFTSIVDLVVPDLNLRRGQLEMFRTRPDPLSFYLELKCSNGHILQLLSLDLKITPFKICLLLYAL